MTEIPYMRKWLTSILPSRLLKADLGGVAECYGVYDNFDSINFDDLPDKFVLKATHDSSGATLCKYKSVFNKEIARKI